MCSTYRINRWYKKPAETVILAFLLALPFHVQGQDIDESQDSNSAESLSNPLIWSGFLKGGSAAWAVNNTARRFPRVDLYQDNYRPPMGNASDPLAPRHVMAISWGLRVGFGVNYEATLVGLILAAVTGTGAAIVHSRAEEEIGMPPAFPVLSPP